jgi:hypothetical protein
MMPTSARLTILMLALAGAALPAAADPDSALILSLGREAGWKDFPLLSGTGFQRAKDGTLDLTLASAEYKADDDTDLLVHFDDRLRDEASRYRVAPEPNPIKRGFSAVGGGSAVFRGQNPVVLQASGGALLAPGRGLGDFTIEFWLYPTRVDDGETVFEWQGGRTSSGTFETQDLRAAFENGRLVWTLQNIFAPSPMAPAVTISIPGGSLLIPGQWHHHLLRYRAGTGLLEYLVDGKTEGLTHATPSGTEDGKPYGAVLGPRTRAEVTLGGNYDGALDELRLSRVWIENPQTDRYIDGLSQKGTAISRIFDLRFPGSTVESIKVRSFTEGNSAVVWSYRMADTIRYQWQFSGDTAKSLAAPDAEEDSWIRFNPGTSNLPGDDLSRKAAGRYLQLRVDLLPSGTGVETPRVNQIVVKTRPSPPPPTPAGVEVIPGDGQLTVRWKPVMQGGTEGYLVFFGPRSGQTQGTVAAQGTSPLDVGKVTEVVLSGLPNDQIYYVSVAAYRSSAVSAPSIERAARPQRKLP